MAKATVDTKPFVDLPTTEEFILFPEDNPGTIPIDHGRLEHLRSMSPFVLRLKPPYIGEYIKNPSGRPFSGVARSRGRISATQNKEVAMFKPNLSTHALRPIDGARRDEKDANGANLLSRAGSAYIFKKDEGGTDNWGEVQKIVANDRNTNDEFGWNVGISGDYAVVSSIANDLEFALLF